jgi:hypothetical protein
MKPSIQSSAQLLRSFFERDEEDRGWKDFQKPEWIG